VRSLVRLGRTATTQQWLLLLLWGAICLLLVEIRVEHQAVLADKVQAWIPIVYLGLIAIAIPAGLFFSVPAWPKFLAGAFAGLAIVGVLGFWLHAKADPLRGLVRILITVTSEPGQLLESGEGDPVAPLLAPISLVGLGAMGVLVSLWRTKQESDLSRRPQDNQGEA
jgi:hypothetical protein